MRITVASGDFLRELELLSKVVASKPTIPVLANCLIQAEGTGLRLAATDLEIGLITFCLATVHEPGVTTLPVKHLLDIVRLLPDQDLTLTLNGNSQVALQAGKYASHIQTYQAADYPQMPSMRDLPTVNLPTNMQELVKRVRFAISDKDKRYYLDGAQLSNVALAATDAHRLAYTTCAVEVAEPVIIPRQTLDALADLATAETLFAIGPNHLFFVMDGRMLFSRMVAGKFPNYQRIVPTGTDRVLNVGREDLRDALQRITLTNDAVVFTIQPGALRLTGQRANVGDAAEQVDILYDGPQETLTLNGKYILEFLGVATSPQIAVQWKAGSTILFTDGEAYAYVQMPLRSV